MRMEFDDLFIYGASFLSLDEGKAIGTAERYDLRMVADIARDKALMDPRAFATERKRGQTVGKRKLVEVQDRVRDRLLVLISDYQTRSISEAQLRAKAKALMHEAWRQVFFAGVRASGTQGSVRKPELFFEGRDDKWLKGAIQHEMRFLNGFMDAVINETYRMPLDRRVEMYVNALTAFYESARVMGMPDNVVIHWAGPHDKRTCASCRYLFEHSPYNRTTLPTAPRSGLTQCLTNCRDRLFIRRVELHEALRIGAESGSRESHIRALRRIKRLRLR
jgi:hypothetical protein